MMQLGSNRLISRAEARAISLYSYASMNRKSKNGTFPKSVRLGDRRVGFLKSELDAWLEARIAESRPLAAGSLA